MVKEGRRDYVQFPSGSLTADANGNFQTYAERPIEGRIVKVDFRGGNLTNTGSVFLRASGTEEPIWSAVGRASGNLVEYPMLYAVDQTGTSMSGNGVSWRELGGYDGMMEAWASGCGNGTSGVNLTVYYGD